MCMYKQDRRSSGTPRSTSQTCQTKHSTLDTRVQWHMWHQAQPQHNNRTTTTTTTHKHHFTTAQCISHAASKYHQKQRGAAACQPLLSFFCTQCGATHGYVTRCVCICVCVCVCAYLSSCSRFSCVRGGALLSRVTRDTCYMCYICSSCERAARNEKQHDARDATRNTCQNRHRRQASDYC